MEQDVRWNIKVSKETDLSLRGYLGEKGMKKGDLSKFIEKAVNSYVFERTVEDIRASFADTDPDELQPKLSELESRPYAAAEITAFRDDRNLTGFLNVGSRNFSIRRPAAAPCG